MPSWTVVIETRGAGDAPLTRDAFEITPPPEPGTERAVLEQLVTGIHPGAVERTHAAGVSTFDDGGRTITAHFDVAAATPEATAEEPPQGTLFDT